MRSAVLILTGAFWVSMNVLLWKSEYGGGNSGNPLPVQTVISKILETPDPSDLDILYQNERVGGCRWVVTQLGLDDKPPIDDPTLEVDLESAEMSGLIADVQGYAIHVDGHLQGGQQTRRIRFLLEVQLSRNWEWTSMHGKAGFRNQWFHIHSIRQEEKVLFKFESDDGKLDLSFNFDELRNPKTVFDQLTGQNPMVSALLIPMLGQWDLQGAMESPPSAEAGVLGFNWVAFADWMSIAHSRMRIYRIKSEDSPQPNISVIVNRAGEILEAKLPQGIQLKNEEILGF